MKLRSLSTILAGLALTASCGDPDTPIGGGDDDFDYRQAAVLIPDDVTEVDVLFVVDDSASMQEEQDSLAAKALSFFDQLVDEEGELFDVHIGVISSSMTISAASVTQCESGPDGALQAVPSGACSAPSDPYISNIRAPDGQRITNYAGSLEDTFSCIVKLGTGGCGFEQPLEAMRTALDGSLPQNNGFLRQDALLAVIFLTDEDDCSIADPLFFDGAPGAEALSSVQCFLQGVTCDDAPTGSAVGDYADCSPDESSLTVTRVSEYVSFLKGLKASPHEIFVGVIAGYSDPIEIVNVESPSLAPTCESANGLANPAVRLRAFADAFALGGTLGTICDVQMSVLDQIGANITATATRNPCLRGEIGRDAEGVPLCRAYAERYDGVGDRIPLPLCGDDDEGPCVGLVEAPEHCADTPSHLAAIPRDTGDATVVLECATDAQ